jgi:hypothetical protein
MSQQMYLNGLSPPAGKDIFCLVWDRSAHCSYPAAVLQTRKVASVSADGSRRYAAAVVQFLDVFFGSS